MTDWTETHRTTLEAWLDIPATTPNGPLDAAIRAALAEIASLTDALRILTKDAVKVIEQRDAARAEIARLQSERTVTLGLLDALTRQREAARQRVDAVGTTGGKATIATRKKTWVDESEENR